MQLRNCRRRGHAVRTKLPCVPNPVSMPSTNDIDRRSPPASAAGGCAIATPFRCTYSSDGGYDGMLPLSQTTK
jgi:hypothetical protein|eukprot:COSAG02_NODE_856_length_16468_cov_131.787831_14_plen_73_part_00